jgi:hypothetical protein
MNLKVYPISEERANFQKITINIDLTMYLSCDLYFRIKHKGSFKNRLICRFALNPAFVIDK